MKLSELEGKTIQFADKENEVLTIHFTDGTHIDVAWESDDIYYAGSLGIDFYKGKKCLYEDREVFG